jgi:hypothetical protein
MCCVIQMTSKNVSGVQFINLAVEKKGYNYQTAVRYESLPSPLLWTSTTTACGVVTPTPAYARAAQTGDPETNWYAVRITWIVASDEEGALNSHSFQVILRIVLLEQPIRCLSRNQVEGKGGRNCVHLHIMKVPA